MGSQSGREVGASRDIGVAVASARGLEVWACKSSILPILSLKRISRAGWRLRWHGIGPDPKRLFIQGSGPTCSPTPRDSSASGDEAQGLHCVPGVLSTAEGCTAVWGDLLLPWINQCLCPALAAGFKRLIVVQGACAGFGIG